MINIFRNILFFAFSTLFLLSCNLTKELEDGQFLLKKNSIHIVGKSKVLVDYNMVDFIKQKNNKHLLGLLPVQLWYHSVFPKKGEKPVIYQESLSLLTEKRMLRYVKSLGYFNANIRVEKRLTEKKIWVDYIIEPHQLYTIRNYSQSISDSAIASLLEKYRKEKLIKVGDNYNEYIIDDERDRVTQVLNNEGYYKFTKEYVSFKVDTNLNSHQLDIELYVKDFKQGVRHKPFHFRNISLSIMKDAYQESFSDSIKYIFPNQVRLTYDSLKLRYNSPLKVKPFVFIRNLYIHSGDSYNLSHLKKSIQRLNRLNISKRINVNITEIDSLGILDADIKFIKKPVHYYTVETQGSNRGGDLGLGVFLNYSNRNLFGNSELFNLRLNGAIEYQHFIEKDSPLPGNEILKYNTVEWGANASIFFPFLLAPVSQQRYFSVINPRSSTDIGYTYQQRVDYRRTVTYASLGYKWKVGNSISHHFNPIEINFVKVGLTEDFKQRLLEQPLRIQSLYEDHLIFAIKYSLIYGKRSERNKQNSFFYRLDLESSGNMLKLYTFVNGIQASEGVDYQTLFGVRYAQYIKSSNDFRYYLRLNKKNNLAFRSFIGIGLPLKNSSFLPLERAFYGGGANSMRAWRLRFLGPGGYAGGGDQIERFGDLLLEANFEYRFPIYRFLNGAFFYDVGNIWLINDNYTYPNGAFSFNTFLPELAMDIGIGFRFDFSIFMFRLDVAQKIKDPSYPLGHRWVFEHENWFLPVLSFGIGYPF